MDALRRTAVLVLALGACASPDARAPGASISVSAVPSADAGRVTQAELPLLEALGRAVEADQDEVAAQLLARLLARGPSPRAREIADGYERVLAGRAAVRQLTAWLVARPLPDGARGADGEFALVLVLRNDAPRAVRLSTGPATLAVERVVVDAAGREQHGYESAVLAGFDRLSLAGGAELELELSRARAAAPEPGLAARVRWRLALRAGTLESDGRTLPAQEIPVRDLERTCLARRLAGAPVGAAELAAALELRGLEPSELLELAVRVAPEERERAFERAAELALGLSVPRLERALPALSWLALGAPGSAARGAPAGGDVREWRAWLRERDAAGRVEPGLALPRRPRTPAQPLADGGEP